MEIKFNENSMPDILLGYKNKQKLSECFYENEVYNRSSNPLLTTRLVQYGKMLSMLNSLNISNVKSLKILDVGCGDGAFVQYLLSQGYSHVEGIDPAVNFSENSPCKKASIEEYIGLEDRYDLIFFNDVFEHFDNPEYILDNITILLNNNGFISLKVPNKESLLYKIAKCLYRVGSRKLLHALYQVDAPPPHYYYYSCESLDSMVEPYGLTPKKKFYLSEFPIKGLWSRVWHFNGIKKIFIIFVFLIYNVLTYNSMHDSLCVIYRKTK